MLDILVELVITKWYSYLDDEIDEALEPWNVVVDAEGSVVIGSTLVTLSRTGCYYSECTLGNFVTDAYVFAVSISFLSSGKL